MTIASGSVGTYVAFWLRRKRRFSSVKYVPDGTRENGNWSQKGCQSPLKAPGCPGAEDLPHHDPDIGRCRVKLQPLLNVLSAPDEYVSQRSVASRVGEGRLR